jgi:hypothetical protein
VARAKIAQEIKLDASFSPRTVDYIHHRTKHTLKQAHRRRLVAQNVSEAVDPPVNIAGSRASPR